MESDQSYHFPTQERPHRTEGQRWYECECEHLLYLRIAARGNQRPSQTILDRADTSTSLCRTETCRWGRRLESRVKSLFLAVRGRDTSEIVDRPPRAILYTITCSQRANFAVIHKSGTRATSFSKSRNLECLFHPGDLGERRPRECRQLPIQAPHPRNTGLAHPCDHRNRHFHQPSCNRNQCHCPA